MIDWLSAVVGYDTSGLDLGVMYALAPGGELEFVSPRWSTARASHDGSMRFRSRPAPEGILAEWSLLPFQSAAVCLELDGNPSKFIQGHNVAGPSVSRLGPVVQAVARGLGAFSPAGALSDVLPCVRRSRVDITTAVDLYSDEAVHEYLRVLAASVRSHQDEASVYRNGVVYQAGSRRWSLTFYCKYCELGRRPPKVEPALLQELREWSCGHLRIELRLWRPELAQRGVLDESLIWDYYSRLRFPVMSEHGVGADALRGDVKLLLEHWYLRGPDALLPLSNGTKYRRRKEILKATGIDVLLPRDAQSSEARSVLLSLAELKAREVKHVPELTQRSLLNV